VEALVLAILDGHHALYKVGQRLEERGMVTLLQPGLTRAALHDHRLGHILDALCAANLNRVFSAVALHALDVYAIATPWLHQDTTTMALYGAYEDEPQTPGAPRPAYGHSKLRFLVVHSSQLAQQHTQTYASAQAQEAEALTAHVQRVHARWFACQADAAAAITEYEHQEPGRRGRRPHLWRYHTVRYRVTAATRRRRRPQRGRPAKTDPPPLEAGYRLVVDVEALANPEEAHGWMVLATTVPAEVCSDPDILQAYQDQNATVEPGFRWIKNPAAIAPVWLEKPERMAALAILTVVGLLVYSSIQRQIRLSLHMHNRQIPGNKGLTATPTAAVVLTLFAQVALIQLVIDDQEVEQSYGVQPHHLLLCDALGLDRLWYTAPSAQKSARGIQPP
jgi:transposase